MMYPGDEGSPENHKRGICSDGVVSRLRGSVPWPQPKGIFSTRAVKSKTEACFHPVPFLRAVQLLFHKIVVEAQTFNDLDLEYQALASLLQDRVFEGDLANGRVSFRLLDDVIIENKQAYSTYIERKSVVVTKNNVETQSEQEFLRIDCLQNFLAAGPGVV